MLSWRSRRAWLTLVACIVLGLAVDLGSKWWCFTHGGPDPILLQRKVLLENPNYNPVHPPVRKDVLPHGLVSMHLVLNPGAVFGFGAHRRDFFIGFTIVAVSIGMVVFSLKTTSIDWRGHVGIGLALAGGLGNFYDRLFIGRVRDFIQFAPDLRLPHGWTWPGTNNPELMPWVFNIADLLLLIGMLMVLGHLQRRREAMANQSESAEAALA